jgi:hypothetical protein
MSIISCSECGEKISSQAPMCLHCGSHREDFEITDEQQLVLKQRKARDKIYHQKMISYAIMTVFGLGFGWYWWQSKGFFLPSGKGPFMVMGLSVLAYLVLRVFMLQAERKLRALKRIRIQ